MICYFSPEFDMFMRMFFKSPHPLWKRKREEVFSLAAAGEILWIVADGGIF
jgi:hypothetical protein